MTHHPSSPSHPYISWKVKMKFRLNALLAIPEEKRSKVEWERIVDYRRRLSTNPQGTPGNLKMRWKGKNKSE
jgi:hypothetical protein